MKRILVTLVVFSAIPTLTAQKFGHFSSEYIVQQMPSYQRAQQEINTLSLAWMEDVKNRYLEIGRLENKLATEKILLTSDMILDRENEIDSMLKAALDYQHRIFGPDGLFFLKKEELLKPELNKVFDAVEIVSKKHRLDYLLDKSGQLVMVYTNPVHDYTDYILEELNLRDNN